MEIFFWNSFFFFNLLPAGRQAARHRGPVSRRDLRGQASVLGARSALGGWRGRAAGGRSTPGRVRAEPERASSGILREKILYQTLPLKMT